MKSVVISATGNVTCLNKHTLFIEKENVFV